MLRTGLLIFGCALMVAGLVFLFQGNCAYKPLLFWGSVLVIAVLGERWRYQRQGHDRERQWQQTGERFEDPESGETVEVQYDPASGERRYVRK